MERHKAKAFSFDFSAEDQDDNRSKSDCFYQNCDAEGKHRAPKSPQERNTFIALCDAHIKEHNQNWNYYAGMSEEEVRREDDHDLTWRRPRRPFSTQHQRSVHLDMEQDFFTRVFQDKHSTPRLPFEVQQALKTFSLQWPVSKEQVLKRYRALVKQHHPDVTAGKEGFSATFDSITKARRTLLRFIG